jgi:hypothetical protein
MKIVIERSEPHLLGRRQELLLDISWWAAVAHRTPSSIMIVQTPNGAFDSVAIEFESDDAVADFRYKLSTF